MATVEEMKAMIGKHGSEITLEADKSMVRLYCDTVGDRNPKWAKVFPPGLLTGAMFVGEGTHMEWPYPVIVDAGLDLEFFKPIKPGDVLTVTNELYNVEDKSSEKGKRLLISFRSTLKNQRGEAVATSTGRVMNIG